MTGEDVPPEGGGSAKESKEMRESMELGRKRQGLDVGFRSGLPQRADLGGMTLGLSKG